MYPVTDWEGRMNTRGVQNKTYDWLVLDILFGPLGHELEAISSIR